MNFLANSPILIENYSYSINIYSAPEPESYSIEKFGSIYQIFCNSEELFCGMREVYERLEKTSKITHNYSLNILQGNSVPVTLFLKREWKKAVLNMIESPITFMNMDGEVGEHSTEIPVLAESPMMRDYGLSQGESAVIFPGISVTGR